MREGEKYVKKDKEAITVDADERVWIRNLIVKGEDTWK